MPNKKISFQEVSNNAEFSVMAFKNVN